MFMWVHHSKLQSFISTSLKICTIPFCVIQISCSFIQWLSHTRMTAAALQFTHSSVWLLPARFANTWWTDTWNDDRCCRRRDCRVLVGWSGAGRTDESFVFLLIDADILSCLLLPHFSELYLSNWHVPSLCYTARHWCVHLPSLCISPLLCLPLLWFPLTRFLLCMSLATPPHWTPHSCLSDPPNISSLLPPFHIHPAGLPASPVLDLLHHPKLPSSLLLPCLPLHTCFFTLHSPTRLPPLLLPLCSTPVSRQFCQMLREVSFGSCDRGIEWWWPIMVLHVLQVCCELWCNAQMPFIVQRALRRQLMHQSQAGRETTGSGCSPKV